MVKVALIFTTIFLLAFSGAPSSTHSNQMVFGASHFSGQSVSAGSRTADNAGVQALVPPIRAVGIVPAADDAPAPALLVYLALILLGSAVAVGLVRRSYRRQG